MDVKLGFCGSCVSYNSFKQFDNDYVLMFKEERPIISYRDKDNSIRLSNNELLENDIIINELSEKELVNQLNSIDYLVIDLYYDFIYCSDVNDNETFNMWKKSIDDSFNYVQSNFSNIKIILTPLRLVEQVLNDDIIEQKYSETISKYNPLIEKLEQYLIENYDIYHTIFPSNVTYDGSFTFKEFLNYNNNFFENLYYQIHSIILEDQLSILKNKCQNYPGMMIDEGIISEEELCNMYNEINDFKENIYVYNKFNQLQTIKKDNEIINKKLRDKEEEVRQLVKFKKDVYSSLSWKITKPLRIAKKIRK